MDTVEHTEDSSLNIQNDFFNNARKNHTRITVFLTNGQRISGLIRSFDKFTLILETRNGDQMVFKHAITTVAGARPGDEDFRGARPGRPPMGDRGGDHRPGGPGRPPRTAPPGGPPQGRPPGAPAGEAAHAGGPKHEGDHRPRGGSGPQGKSFGNFMDLSSIQKAKNEAAGAGADGAPAAEKPMPAQEPQVAADPIKADAIKEEKPAGPDTTPTSS